MPLKDQKDRMEYHREWRNKNPNYMKEWRKKNPNACWERYRKENPNAKRRSFYDFEAHYQLAIHSGIQSNQEWLECHKMGLFPDGIYANPAEAFKRKGPLKNNNTP